MSRADELRVRDYLGHILEAIERIDRYVGNVDEAEFQRDDKTQDAVIRNFEIIGEACHNVQRFHPEIAARYHEVPWSIAYEMRNALAHGYFLVDMEVVWRTIHNDLPGMAEQVRRLLEAE